MALRGLGGRRHVIPLRRTGELVRAPASRRNPLHGQASYRLKGHVGEVTVAAGRIRRSGVRATAGVLAAAALLISACGEPEAPEQPAGLSAGLAPSPSATPDPAAAGSTAPAPTSSATAAAPARASGGLCRSADLKLSLGKGDGAAGTVWRPLRFTNVSGTPCVVRGFPGVSYVAGEDGHQVGAAAYRDGSKGAAVTLAPGKTAYAAVGFTQVANYDPEDCRPTAVRGLRVYPPQETHSMYLANPGRGCANEDLDSGYHLKVHTIRPGSGPS